MKKCFGKLFALSMFAVTQGAMSDQNAASADLCLENICIGDDVELLDVDWKPIPLTYTDTRFVERRLNDGTVEDVYYDYNEQLVADNAVLKQLLPYVILNQQFDRNVLDTLSRVRAICSSLTLTGEVNIESEDRLFVTFRAIANEGRRGKLRVVRLERQYDIMSPHLRGGDRIRYKNKKEELQQRFPQLKTVVDIDGRRATLAVHSDEDAVLGFRFISDSYNPLVLKLIDFSDIPMIEEDPSAHALCRTKE